MITFFLWPNYCGVGELVNPPDFESGAFCFAGSNPAPTAKIIP